ncbi:phosphate/phosphite/phosphonate ABC transporter substrate-binding protein [Actinomadura sp. KC216]|uniref:phosphate/phosphite/phosphonate ABC transporter substrate-binding protein n=1 Tax=Actinomadura sp. KC216 TaxID=2530370 RepID=UPI00104338F8|nr:phosphate/phosphite/phosphonate ABC transporter substrate-binding protein [Actinomadura sp. KC216]TDB89009.1 phosphate/phosphite/phosphonate ABC transporter substrate-binding protein [Actinomadura sp. KC216]
MKRVLATLAAVVSLLVLVACSAGGASVNEKGVPKKLRVGLIPNIAPDKQRARYKPLQAYLERELDAEIELFVATDYSGVVEALASDRLDLAYLGGLTYVQAERKVKLTPVVTEIDRETGTREYLSAVVVKSGSAYRTTADLVAAKASFAFGDISSTSGSLYPRAMLADAGVKADSRDPASCPPLSKVSFTGGHDAVAQSVLTGATEAGGIELRILHRLEGEGSVPKGALRAIETRRVTGYPWVVRTEVGSRAIQEITGAFTRIDDPALLDLLRAKSYAKVSPSDYDEIRRYAERFGLGV